MLRLDPTSSCLTSTHLVFVHLCLQERCFRDALPILDNDVFHFPTMYDKNSNQPLLCAQHETSSTYITNTSGISEKLYCNHHLQYFLYGAMLYIGVKDWNRALLFLEIVLRSPTSGNASMIQVEAYKKFVLVGLLLGGRVSKNASIFLAGPKIPVGSFSLLPCRGLRMHRRRAIELSEKPMIR